MSTGASKASPVCRGRLGSWNPRQFQARLSTIPFFSKHRLVEATGAVAKAKPSQRSDGGRSDYNYGENYQAKRKKSKERVKKELHVQASYQRNLIKKAEELYEEQDEDLIETYKAWCEWATSMKSFWPSVVFFSGR